MPPVRQDVEQKQLIFRCDEVLIRRLKVVAAHQNISMAEFARSTLSGTISELRGEDPGIEQALEAAKL